MVDLHRNAPFPADADGFVNGFEQLIGLGPHVRDVDAAVGRHGTRHLDQLGRAREVPGRIDQRGGDAQGAVLHGAAHHGAHGVQLGGRGLAQRHAFHIFAHRRGAQERPDVGRDAVTLHRFQPAGEASRRHELAHHGLVLRRQPRQVAHGTVVGWRRGPPLPEDLRGDALGHLAHVAAVAEQEGAARLALDVNESRGHDHAAGIQAFPSRCVA